MAWVAIDRVARVDRRARRSAATRARRCCRTCSALRGADPRRGLRARLQPARGRVHAVVRQRRARRERPGHAALRVPARQRSARAGHGGGGREDAAARRLRAPLRAPSTAPTGCPERRARSWRAASGWPTTTRSRGRLDEAEALFERLLSLRNHLGLLSEEYDPKLQRQIGNFPQAFSHLALIITAQVIESVSQNRSWTRPAAGVSAPAS